MIYKDGEQMKNNEQYIGNVKVVKAEDIPFTDEWMQEDEWDEIYRKEVETDDKRRKVENDG